MDSPLHYEVPPNNNGQAIIRLLFGFVSHSVFSMCQTQKIIICHNHHLYQTQSQRGATVSHGLDAAFSSRLHRPAWRQLDHCNRVHCRDCARYLIEQRQASNPIPGGATFSLRHSGEEACGIPDGETLILTGGDIHTFVTRWEHEHRNSFSYGHEDANNDNPNTFEKQMCETAQKRP